MRNCTENGMAHWEIALKMLWHNKELHWKWNGTVRNCTEKGMVKRGIALPGDSNNIIHTKLALALSDDVQIKVLYCSHLQMRFRGFKVFSNLLVSKFRPK